MIEEELLGSQVIVMTGGRDNYGHPILSFTPKLSDKLAIHTTAAHLIHIAQYLMTLAGAPSQSKGFAFLANLRSATRESIQMMVEGLDRLQMERQGSVAAFFTIQPKSKELQRCLKKLVGLKPSKKHPKIPIYETILVSDIPDLGKHMDGTQLTADYGGSMKYNHTAWMQFTKEQNALEQEVKKTLEKVPDAHDRIAMMMEYDVPESTAEAQQLVLQIRQKYQDVMRDLNLEHSIDKCKMLMGKLDNPARHPEYMDIARTPSFITAKDKVKGLERRLQEAREELKKLWQASENRIMSAAKVKKYIVKGDKVLDWIKNVGVPTVNQDPEIADCLSKAEILKNHFETGFYSIAKNVLWLCGKIEKKFDEIVLETKGNNEEVLKYSKKFQTSTNYFGDLMEKKYAVYINVYNFYLNSNKSPLEGMSVNPELTIHTYLVQITKWYQRTLRFLPLHLLRQQVVTSSGKQTTIFQVTAAWKATVENYVLHHPAPLSQHLQKLTNVIPVIDSIAVRNQARLLVHRVEMVTRLLYTANKISVSEMQEVVRWKEQVTRGYDDITLNFASSTMDLSRLGELDPANGNMSRAHSTQSLHSNRAPKLRLALRAADSGDEPYYSLDRQQTLGERLAMAESGRQRNRQQRRARPKSAVGFYDNGSSMSLSGGVQTPEPDVKNKQPAYHRSLPRLDLTGQEGSGHHPRLSVYDPNGQSGGRVSRAPGEIRSGHHRSLPRLDLTGQESSEHHPLLSVYDQSGHSVAGSSPHPGEAGPPAHTLGHSSGHSPAHSPGRSPRHSSGQERYVSLGDYPQKVPPALQHLSHKSSGQGPSLPHKYDSTTDSGITNSRSDSTNKSQTSLNKAGLSPAHGSRLPRAGSLSHGHSLPDLLSDRTGLDQQLAGKQANIELIAGSSLSAEEKLNLMAAMCAGEDTDLPSEINYKLSKTSPKGKTTLKGSGHTRPKSSGAIPTLSLPPQQSIGATPKDTNSVHLTKEIKVNHSEKVGDRNWTLKPPVVESDSHTSVTSDTTVTTAIQLTDARLRSNRSAASRHALGMAGEGVSGVGRSGSQRYGIDVAEWVSQQDPRDVSSLESSEALSHNEGMEDYVHKLQTARNNRKVEEAMLVEERKRLEDISIDEEEVHQDEVERTLRRAEKLLMDQERLTNEKSREDYEEYEPPPLSSSPPPYLSEPDTEGRGSGHTERTPGDLPRRREGAGGGKGPRPLSGEKPPREYDGSVSEESGVYTQASNDSRLKLDDSPVYTGQMSITRTIPGLTSLKPLSKPLKMGSVKTQTVVRPETVNRGSTQSQAVVRPPSETVKTGSTETQAEVKLAPETVKTGSPKTHTVAKPSPNGVLKNDTRNRKYQEKEIVFSRKPVSLQLTVQDIDIDSEPSPEEKGEGWKAGSSTLQDEADQLGQSDYTVEGTGDGGGGEVDGVRSKVKVSPAQVSEFMSRSNGQGEPIKSLAHVTKMSETKNNIHIPEHRKSSAPSQEASLTDVCSDNSSDIDNTVISHSEDSVNDVEYYSGMRTSQYSDHSGGGENDTYSELVGPTYSTELLNLKTPVIIDNGSGLCKCGLASDSLPSSVFPAYVGRPKYKAAMTGKFKDHYVGEAAENMRGVLNLKYPLEHGIVTDWDDMELIWNHALCDQLRINPEEHPVMLTEPPMNPRQSRERMVEVMFEYFDVPAMYVAMQAVLALYASGRTTGVVFDSGDGVSHIVPVYEGFTMTHASTRINLAGRDLTDYLVKLLREGGHSLTTSAEREIARDIKEKLCYVAENYEQEVEKSETTYLVEDNYTLPDGHVVDLNSERFRCPEALFKPSLLGYESQTYGGIHESIYNTVAKCDVDLRRDLFSNILLSGGSSLFPGLSGRVQREVSALCAPSLASSVRIHSPEDRQYSVWQGGAVLASLSSFNTAWVFSEEYREIGADIVHRKCF